MYVKIGHLSTLDFVSSPPGSPPRLSVLTGSFETQWIFPEGTDTEGAFSAVIGSVPSHVDLSARNQIGWIESNDPRLEAALKIHYHPNHDTRPPLWGEKLNRKGSE